MVPTDLASLAGEGWGATIPEISREACRGRTLRRAIGQDSSTTFTSSTQGLAPYAAVISRTSSADISRRRLTRRVGERARATLEPRFPVLRGASRVKRCRRWRRRRGRRRVPAAMTFSGRSDASPATTDDQCADWSWNCCCQSSSESRPQSVRLNVPSWSTSAATSNCGCRYGRGRARKTVKHEVAQLAFRPLAQRNRKTHLVAPALGDRCRQDILHSATLRACFR